VDLASPQPAVISSLAPYLESRGAQFLDWLADGSMLVTTRFGETTQVHHVRAPLAMREQLSFEPDGVSAAAAQPAHDTAFVALEPRAGGNAALSLEQPQQHLSVSLTDGSARDGAALWSHDGQRLVFSSHHGTGSEREIYLLDTRTLPATPTLVAGGGDARWQVFDWSLDDQRLLLGRSCECVAGEVELYMVQLGAELGRAEPTALALVPTAAPAATEHRGERKAPPPPAPLRARAARFAPDGRGILALRAAEPIGGSAGGAVQSSAGAGFWQLRHLDPVGGEERVLSSPAEHDVELFDQSPDGRYLAYTLDDGGTSRLQLIDLSRKLEIAVPALPPGIIDTLKFDATGKRLALSVASASAPSDVYVFEPDTQELTRWTQSELGMLDPTRLVLPSVLRFPTWDRVEGQQRVLRAYGYQAAAAASAPRPVLILLRSGDGTQFRPGYDALLQFLVNELGFVVLAPQVRGSTGAGRAFEALGQGALRDDAVRDVGSLLVWIGLQRELDRNRVFVMGEAHGSYLALASLAQYGDRLRGGIAAFLPHIGPLANVASFHLPVLLVQGQSDPEAPAYESEQLAARLRVNGAEVQYLAAAQESGSFQRKSNRDAYYEAAANFLAQSIH
jgi:dipeptidyl aminopeptidase/acylaminoacyl peptidase